MPRDNQRSKVYRAEKIPLHHRPELDTHTLDTLRKELEDIMATSWFKHYWPNIETVRLERKLGNMPVYAHRERSIRLVVGTFNLADLLHELAHACNHAGQNFIPCTAIEGHGARFVGA